MAKRAVLLVNLGSPDSPDVSDVRRYLAEFLTDERVIDRPGEPWRSLLVNRVIIPRRVKNSAHAYAKVWTEDGSPLVATSLRVQQQLATALVADDVPVFLAMRYGTPAIATVLPVIAAAGVDEVLLFPQYPHYAMSSYETVVEKVYAESRRLGLALRFTTVQPFFEDADYVAALVESARPFLGQPYDHLLFSYHGLPERHMKKADSSRAHCFTVPDCCTTCSPAHATCYRAQTVRTTAAFARLAGLDSAKFSISYQSRLGNEPWLTPYTDHEFIRLAKSGRKKLLVITPAFTADCLETLEEIRMAGQETFIAAGGEAFTHIPCLNEHPAFLALLVARTRAWLTGGAPASA
ncbi:MAG: ferrochelatase [Verrucomicrobiota bacterium]